MFVKKYHLPLHHILHQVLSTNFHPSIHVCPGSINLLPPRQAGYGWVVLLVLCPAVGTMWQLPLAGLVCEKLGFGRFGPGFSPSWNGISVFQGTLRNNIVMFTPNKPGSMWDAYHRACASLVPRDGYFGVRSNTLLSFSLGPDLLTSEGYWCAKGRNSAWCSCSTPVGFPREGCQQHVDLLNPIMVYDYCLTPYRATCCGL